MDKNKKQKIIIGGGISGLIFAYYNPEYTIISPDIGGQLTHGIYKMTWVHHTPETEKLLRDLKMDIKPTKTLIGYYYNGKVHDECIPEANEKIIKKKMTDWNTPSNKFEIKDKTLSVPENYIDTLDTDFNKVIDILSKKVKVINDYIIKIDDKKIEGQNSFYKYEQLISTMPALIFWKTYKYVQYSPDLKSDPITFIVTTKKPEWYNNKYEMIYIADDEYFTRVSYRGEGYYVYEFTGVMPEKVFIAMYGGVIEKHMVNPTGRIHTIENKSPQKNIRFLGRFAEWIHHSKIQNVIKFALNNKL